MGRRKSVRKPITYAAAFYTLKPLDLEIRSSFALPGNPYRAKDEDDPSIAYLKSLMVLHYRDKFSAVGVIIDYPEFDIKTEELNRFNAYWHSVVLETDNATYCHVAKWPEGRLNKKYNDPYAWQLFNHKISVNNITDRGVFHVQADKSFYEQAGLYGISTSNSRPGEIITRRIPKSPGEGSPGGD